MKILVADDSEITRFKLESILSSWNYDVVQAIDGAEAWTILQQDETIQIAILDWLMPGLSGIDICKNIREQKERIYTYTIILTSRNNIDDIILGLKSGADDYLIKPYHTQELKARLQVGERIITLQNNLFNMANHDSLTGVLNRRSIIKKCDTELNRSKRKSVITGIIMADLDHFKQINDLYGHQAGDAVLVECTQRIQQELRSYDSLGRYGGEEFLILTPDTNPKDILKHAERIRQSISNSLFHYQENVIPVTMSMGVATSDDNHYESDTLIRLADDALYEAKEKGRNRIIHATI